MKAFPYSERKVDGCQNEALMLLAATTFYEVISFLAEPVLGKGETTCLVELQPYSADNLLCLISAYSFRLLLSSS